jgi:uncharacterized membrane protein YhaH (DUF805 family)
MNPFDRYFMGALRRYADFTGRATRREYWMFFLFALLITIGLGIVDSMLGTLFIASAFNLAIFIPWLAVAARRLHDIDRSGWWLLIGFIPLIGSIVLIVFFVMGSTEDNEYGPKPDLSA